MCHLECYRNEGEAVLKRRITGDMTWVHYLKLEIMTVDGMETSAVS
jgi:hypothetical protein